MLALLIGAGIFFLFVLLLGGGIYQVIKVFFPDKKDPDYLEHFTTDGRPREEVFPVSKDNEPVC